MPKEASKEIIDFMLTPYACYLVAQNGDPRKPKQIIGTGTTDLIGRYASNLFWSEVERQIERVPPRDEVKKDAREPRWCA